MTTQTIIATYEMNVDLNKRMDLLESTMSKRVKDWQKDTMNPIKNELKNYDLELKRTLETLNQYLERSQDASQRKSFQVLSSAIFVTLTRIKGFCQKLETIVENTNTPDAFQDLFKNLEHFEQIDSNSKLFANYFSNMTVAESNSYQEPLFGRCVVCKNAPKDYNPIIRMVSLYCSPQCRAFGTDENYQLSFT